MSVVIKCFPNELITLKVALPQLNTVGDSKVQMCTGTLFSVG